MAVGVVMAGAKSCLCSGCGQLLAVGLGGALRRLLLLHPGVRKKSKEVQCGRENRGGVRCGREKRGGVGGGKRGDAVGLITAGLGSGLEGSRRGACCVLVPRCWQAGSIHCQTPARVHAVRTHRRRAFSATWAALRPDMNMAPKVGPLQG